MFVVFFLCCFVLLFIFFFSIRFFCLTCSFFSCVPTKSCCILQYLFTFPHNITQCAFNTYAGMKFMSKVWFVDRLLAHIMRQIRNIYVHCNCLAENKMIKNRGYSYSQLWIIMSTTIYRIDNILIANLDDSQCLYSSYHTWLP